MNMDPITEQTLRRPYVLMTAAYNEAALIERTIQSVVAQTALPERWVIVSDGSTDDTAAIVQRYAAQHDWIRLICVDRPAGRNFGSKIRALRRSHDALRDASYEFIGNLDADIAIGPAYFQDLIRHLTLKPRLGLVAGFVQEEIDGQFLPRKSNRVDSIPHCAQLLRRECYEAIGGYAILKYGGEDWHAQTSVKMLGWAAEAIPALPIYHHRHTGSAMRILSDRIRLGRLDYSVGSDPLFEIFKCLVRISEAPFLIGAAARLTGFWWSCLLREQRPVTPEFQAFLRHEQRAKITAFSRFFERRGMGAATPRFRAGIRG